MSREEAESRRLRDREHFREPLQRNSTENLYREPLQRNSTENISENLYREHFRRPYPISNATPENATAPKITEAGAVKVLSRVKIDKCFCEPVSV
jgi:hypothetical protein